LTWVVEYLVSWEGKENIY